MCYINVDSGKKKKEKKTVQILIGRVDIFKLICLSFMDICSWPIKCPKQKKAFYILWHITIVRDQILKAETS